MTERIRGKVARVLTSRDLVINRGRADGVEVGMKFAVLDPRGENIKDPDTGEVLGSIRRPKVYVRVARVEDDHLSLARTYRTSRVNVGGVGIGTSAFADYFKPPKWILKEETFKTDEAAWEEISEAKSIVKTGDPVEQVLSEAEELETAELQESATESEESANE